MIPGSGNHRKEKGPEERSVSDPCPGSELILETSRCALSMKQWGLVKISVIVNNIKMNSGNIRNSAPWPGRKEEGLGRIYRALETASPQSAWGAASPT